MSAAQHVYVHVPFCSGKCMYCSFYSRPYNEPWAARYLDALQRELQMATSTLNIIPETLYIGGGTPSLLPPHQLDQLLELLRQHLRLDALKEWTIEGNPGTFTPEKTASLLSYGVNRVSLGVQSMDDDVLSAMGRRHNALQTRQTVQSLRESGVPNIGLDLIACLPGVGVATWLQTLRETIALAPNHLSVYALGAEPGSELHARRQRGMHPPVSTKTEQAALAAAEAQFAAAGYQRYETSNYARDDRHCRHNVAVWEGADYIGFGPAAASRIKTQRWTNTPDLVQYCEGMKEHPTPPRSIETLGPETDAVERFMFTFRLHKGVNPEAFATQQGNAARRLLPIWMQKLSRMKQEGLLTQDGDRWLLTPNGRDFADTVAERLLP